MRSLMLYNPVISASVIAWLVAQVLKLMIEAIVKRRINFMRLVDTGGMPSSHTAFVTGLSTAVGMKEGWHSVMFALAVCISAIIIYDATNLRRSAGYHAGILNEIVPQLLHGKVVIRDAAWKNLRELLGHTPFEVFVGAMLGILIALWFFRIVVP